MILRASLWMKLHLKICFVKYYSHLELARLAIKIYFYYLSPVKGYSLLSNNWLSFILNVLYHVLIQHVI